MATWICLPCSAERSGIELPSVSKYLLKCYLFWTPWNLVQNLMCLRCLQPLPDVSACPISVPFWHHLTDFPQGLSDPAECSFDGLWFWPVLRLGQSEHCLPDCRDWLREGHMTQSEPMSCNLGVLAREALSSHWIGGWEEDLLMACCWCSNDRGAILMVGLGSACSYFATVQGEPHLRKMSAGTVGLREAERTFLHLFLLHLFVKP